MTWTFHRLFHVLLLRRDHIASRPSARHATIGTHMNWNFQNLEPMLLLPGGERELAATLHALLVLVHIPHGRAVGIVWCVLCQIGLRGTGWHPFETILVILLPN